MACTGFAVDWLLLHLGVRLGVPEWAARIVSLTSAMQVTFLLNRAFVFHCPEGQSVAVQWVCYMVSNALGNLCNYFVFTTLLSLHRPVLSSPTFALVLGGVVAWIVNYLSARHLVFAAGPGSLMARLGACPPKPAPELPAGASRP